MLREEKLTYQEELERYMEENEVYDVFETMMKKLIIEQPEDPVPFLLDVLQTPQTSRIIIIGPPGSNRKEHALTIAAFTEDDNKYEVITVGDLIKNQFLKKEDSFDRISEARKTYSYTDDDIVIKLVTTAIQQHEKDKKNWIIEGFPRTRAQALALTKMDFIPDRMIWLEVDDNLTKQRVIDRLGEDDAPEITKDPEIIAESAVAEYKTHIEGVKEVYCGKLDIIDGNREKDTVVHDINRILNLKKVNAPRTCPKILLLGPPGAGKTTQAKMISK